MSILDYCTVELDGVPYLVRPITGSVSIGLTRYLLPASETELLGRFTETPFPDATPVRIVKRMDARTIVVKRVPERTRPP